MCSWELVDCRDVIDEEHPEPIEIISNSDRLREILTDARADSGVWLLRDGQGRNFRIGIGPEYGFLWWDDDTSGCGGPALNPTPFDIEDEFFMCEGMAEEIESERLVKVNDAIDGAVEFFETGYLTPKLSWRIWNPKVKSWEVRSAQ